MDNDLNRTMRMFEESLITRNNTSLLGGTPKNQEKSKYLDASLASTEQLLRTLDEERLRTSNYEFAFKSITEADKSLTGSILRIDEPWKTTANVLYTEFFETLQSHVIGLGVIDIIADFARCCSDALHVIKNLKSEASIHTFANEVWLEDECNTWRLLYVIYRDRLTIQNAEDAESMQPYIGDSEKVCIFNLFKRDSLVRESQLIIDWLEYAATQRDLEALHFTDHTVGWENTLHQLQSADTIVFESSKKIVSSLHPDAPNYEGLPLHDLDVEDDKKLCQHVFQQIRCGKLEQAKLLCVNCGHSWRAAMLEGWALYHNPNLLNDNILERYMDTDDQKKDSTHMDDQTKDSTGMNDQTKDSMDMDDQKKDSTGMDDQTKESIPGYKELNEEDLQPLEGNINRDIWKWSSFAYCQQDYLKLYEKAAVAAYCGNLDALLAVCKNWEDYLWAYMKVMVDIRVESEIRDSIPKKYKPLPELYWSQKMSLNDVFKCLESSSNSTVQCESKMPQHIIQKCIILDEIPDLMNFLAEWSEHSEVTTQFLRFAAHLVLFLDHIGQSNQPDISQRVLELYVSKLADMKKTNLVAFYTSKLGSEKQIHIYAAYLEHILDNDERKEALHIGERCDLNVREITKKIVDNIRSRPHEVTASGDLQQKITEIDILKVSAIDWLLIYENQRLEALEQSNALIFSFLTLRKLDAAYLVFNKIPPESVDNILSEGEPPSNVNQIIKEHLSYGVYLDAHEAFNEWFKQFSSKPIPPKALNENAQFVEKIAQEHRESQYKTDIERWKLSTLHLAKSAKTKLYNVLLFPDGWLSGAKDAEFLRSTCIPEITLLLYRVLYESSYYEECVQLADILAAEKYGLYKVFSKDKLGNILIKLADSSVALLNEKKDPWGNVTTE